MTEVGNRVFYDEKGMIHAQLGEMAGSVLPRNPIHGLTYVDLPYGVIDHANERLVGIDPHTRQPIIEKNYHPPSANDRIKELEDQLLLAAENEVGGVL